MTMIRLESIEDWANTIGDRELEVDSMRKTNWKLHSDHGQA
jgi:hypothetical protein